MSHGTKSREGLTRKRISKCRRSCAADIVTSGVSQGPALGKCSRRAGLALRKDTGQTSLVMHDTASGDPGHQLEQDMTFKGSQALNTGRINKY